MSDRGGDLLGRFGISADAEGLWLALLDLGEADPVALARSASLSVSRTNRAIEQLIEHQLVSLSGADGRLRPLEPRLALQAQIARSEREAFTRLEDLYGVRSHLEELSQRHARGQTTASRTMNFEVVLGQPEIQRQLYLIAERAQRVVRSMIRQTTPANMRQGRASVERIAARKVEMRTLVSTAFLADEERFHETSLDQELGDTHRSLPELPTHMVIADDDVAVLPVAPEDVNLGAIFIRERGVVAPMVALFDHLWAIAQPVFAAGATDFELSARNSRVLELIAAGATDTSISRSLGVGTRTIRREVAMLRNALGVGSRMEIVPAAMRRGWL